jgi:hypothetical protein
MPCPYGHHTCRDTALPCPDVREEIGEGIDLETGFLAQIFAPRAKIVIDLETGFLAQIFAPRAKIVIRFPVSGTSVVFHPFHLQNKYVHNI